MTLKRPRQHDSKHLEFIRSMPCIGCGDTMSTEAAHLRAGNRQFGKRPTGMQEKPHDKWALPLCSRCHREQHDIGELKFWSAGGRDPFVIASALYEVSGDYDAAIDVLDAHGVNIWMSA